MNTLESTSVLMPCTLTPTALITPHTPCASAEEQSSASGKENDTHTICLPGATSRTSRQEAAAASMSHPSAVLARRRTSDSGSSSLRVKA